jgi:hypothetical protein
MTAVTIRGDTKASGERWRMCRSAFASRRATSPRGSCGIGASLQVAADGVGDRGLQLGRRHRADRSGRAPPQLTPRGIKVEDKNDIRKRLGRSPDDGDAIVMALNEGAKAAMCQQRKLNREHRPAQANLGYADFK